MLDGDATFTRMWREETGNERDSAFFGTNAWQAFLGSGSHCELTPYTSFRFARKLPGSVSSLGLDI